ncbi:hypothetical protein AYI70_g9086 [Smittium culicis]|uniref:Uncharacterized protein n=1 Tax=Smittium culicis TaxID=133412 RepID=A0A1R1XCX1_9FUNG|nr:hypothetical protein AYI70_g9086 [Smittium culicis]
MYSFYPIAAAVVVLTMNFTSTSSSPSPPGSEPRSYTDACWPDVDITKNASSNNNLDLPLQETIAYFPEGDICDIKTEKMSVEDAFNDAKQFARDQISALSYKELKIKSLDDNADKSIESILNDCRNKTLSLIDRGFINPNVEVLAECRLGEIIKFFDEFNIKALDFFINNLYRLNVKIPDIVESKRKQRRIINRLDRAS